MDHSTIKTILQRAGFSTKLLSDGSGLALFSPTDDDAPELFAFVLRPGPAVRLTARVGDLAFGFGNEGVFRQLLFGNHIGSCGSSSRASGFFSLDCEDRIYINIDFRTDGPEASPDQIRSCVSELLAAAARARRRFAPDLEDERERTSDKMTTEGGNSDGCNDE